MSSERLTASLSGQDSAHRVPGRWWYLLRQPAAVSGGRLPLLTQLGGFSSLRDLRVSKFSLARYMQGVLHGYKILSWSINRAVRAKEAMSGAIKLVCATRSSAEQFTTETALGRSLMLYKWPFVELRLFPNNVAGLPKVYNTVLRESVGNPAILVFIHDDVHLLDFFWPERLAEGLGKFDIIGLAGNKRRLDRQAGWMFLDDKLTRDAPENFSGVIAHGKGWPARIIDYYGPPGVEVKIMDGLLLAAHSETLISNSVAFDELFEFHFYDLDFCRSAEIHGLRMGTWPIQVMHESGGAFNTARWRLGYEKYLNKWQS